MKLQGIFVDATTPFDHTGALWRAKAPHNFEKWSLTAVAGFLVGALTGEGPLLSAEERVDLWRLAAAAIPKDRILLAGVDTPGVAESVSLIRCAAETGCHAAVCGVPHYDRALLDRPCELALYFRAVADRAPIPVWISNRPRATGFDLPSEQILALSEHPNIAGVIEASTDGLKFGRLVQVSRPGFTVLCGEETVLWDALQSGASGAALAFASAAPYAAIALWEAFRTREDEAGLDWQARIARPAELINGRYGLAGLKHAMDLNGYYGGPPRLPWGALDQAGREEIAGAFHDLKG